MTRRMLLATRISTSVIMTWRLRLEEHARIVQLVVRMLRVAFRWLAQQFRSDGQIVCTCSGSDDEYSWRKNDVAGLSQKDM